jgi:fumarylacetoacetase
VGERVVDLAALHVPDVPDAVLRAPLLNPLLEAGPSVWAAVDEAVLQAEASIAEADVEPVLPIAVADYVDFYSSLHHATNVGRMFRPGAEPLPANWRHLPVGYHGRSGTVVVSGTPVRRPRGQLRAGVFGPTERLDFELELGAVIGVASDGPVPVERALDHVFGLVLLEEWRARDVQAWEYQPLGPFLAKSFATSIGAWVTPMAAARACRVPAAPQEPPPLEYLREDPWAFDLDLEVELQGTVVARSSARHLYWSLAQQIAHLTCNGATLRVGDLLGSGTISGPEAHERGCLLELTWNGSEPLRLSDGSERTWLADGDEVVLRGTGLAEVSGRVAPA